MSALRTLAAVAATGTAAIAIPSAAHAAEGFVGVVGGDRVVTLQSDSVPGMSHAKTLQGLPSGEALRALDQAPDGRLLAVSSSSAIYAVDVAGARVTPLLPAVTTPLGAGPTTFAVAPDGATARLINGGRDLTVSLTTGAVVVHSLTAPAVSADVVPDGRLIGADATSDAMVDVGAGFAPLAPIGSPLTGVTETTTASDGTQYVLTGLSRSPKLPQQSRLLHYDPATGKVSGADGPYLLSQLTGLAAIGSVPDDTKAPTGHVTIARQTIAQVRAHRGIVLHLTTNEGGQTLASVRGPGGLRGFGLATLQSPGSAQLLVPISRAKAARLAGRTVRVHVAMHDFARHTKTFDRTIRIAR
jgi:DNA-binding beta-propeller fold protein YncE